MKKKELAQKIEDVEQGVFTSNVRFGRRLDDLASNWVDVFNSLKEIVDKHKDSTEDVLEALQDELDSYNNRMGPDQAEFNRYKTAVAKMFERKALELRGLFDKHDSSMIAKLNAFNGMQDQFTGFEKFITDKFNQLASQLTQNTESIAAVQEEFCAYQKDCQYKRRLDSQVTDSFLKKLADGLDETRSELRGLEQGDKANAEAIANIFKNIETLTRANQEMSELTEAELICEDGQTIKEKLHSLRELWHHRTSVEILQQENKSLKEQLSNLSENFDCLNNTVNEIMKREAIRDRGVKIPCPSTDEYDELMESEELYRLPTKPKQSRPSVEIVVATDCNGVIGVDGKIPWNCPEDLKLFKELTEGHVVVMGRKTYESLPEKFKQGGLPNRTNIIMSRSLDYCATMNRGTGLTNNGIVFVHQEPKYIKEYWTEEANGKIFIIGGEEIYKLWMPYVDVIHHSRIATEVNTEFAQTVAKFEFVDADWGCPFSKGYKDFTYYKLIAMPGAKK